MLKLNFFYLLFYIRLDISIEMIGSSGNEIPMLAVVDNGHGMGHDDISKMVMFGNEQPDTNDPNRIGRFGVGFKVMPIFSYNLSYI